MHLGIIKITYNRTATHFMDDSFVNLGEEVILTLLWQSGASESATVSMFCYLFKYLLLTVQMRSFAHRVCARARVWVRERQGHSGVSYLNRGLCVCQRETGSHHSGVYSPSENRLNRGLFVNTYEHHHGVCHTTLFPSQAWTDGKTKDIINCLYFNFESWSLRLWKGALHFRRGLWCSANHNALCQLANQSRLRLLEGGTL